MADLLQGLMRKASMGAPDADEDAKRKKAPPKKRAESSSDDESDDDDEEDDSDDEDDSDEAEESEESATVFDDDDEEEEEAAEDDEEVSAHAEVDLGAASDDEDDKVLKLIATSKTPEAIEARIKALLKASAHARKKAHDPAYQSPNHAKGAAHAFKSSDATAARLSYKVMARDVDAAFASLRARASAGSPEAAAAIDAARVASAGPTAAAPLAWSPLAEGAKSAKCCVVPSQKATMTLQLGADSVASSVATLSNAKINSDTPSVTKLAVSPRGLLLMLAAVHLAQFAQAPFSPVYINHKKKKVKTIASDFSKAIAMVAKL